MNERIKRLAEQTGAKELGADLYGGEFIGAIRLDFLEKFAEMIIKECADVATINQYQAFTPGYYVKKHFGVEE